MLEPIKLVMQLEHIAVVEQRIGLVRLHIGVLELVEQHTGELAVEGRRRMVDVEVEHKQLELVLELATVLPIVVVVEETNVVHSNRTNLERHLLAQRQLEQA